MSTNNKIKIELNKELNEALDDFKSSSDFNLLKSSLNDLINFDFESFKVSLKDEIKQNLSTIWTNTEEGIDTSIKLDAILFEHYIPDTKDIEAFAYGIIDWEEQDIDGIEVDMGFDYDFNGLEQNKGITLSYFNPCIHNPHAQNTDDYILKECYKLKGLVAIHEVFAELDSENLFDSINKKPRFHFLVGEHDSDCYLVYSIYS